jgi:hypothetical protein
MNQTVNDIRAHPRGIKFAPTGNGANDKGAEFYQNHTREIEYRSHAKMAYARRSKRPSPAGMAGSASRRSASTSRTFDQDVWIEPVVNAGPGA